MLSTLEKGVEFVWCIQFFFATLYNFSHHVRHLQALFERNALLEDMFQLGKEERQAVNSVEQFG